MPKLFWIGLAILVFGTGPLVLVMIGGMLGLTGDPDPNPVGLGLLAAVTFWPGIAVTAIGVLQAVRRGSGS
jgi:crotonobetainyl-CoA:carnitine CoA-transferase CaiB-like acyl-CoA transferase